MAMPGVRTPANTNKKRNKNQGTIFEGRAALIFSAIVAAPWFLCKYSIGKCMIQWQYLIDQTPNDAGKF